MVELSGTSGNTELYEDNFANMPMKRTRRYITTERSTTP
jgi:hypothetical protein